MQSFSSVLGLLGASLVLSLVAVLTERSILQQMFANSYSAVPLHKVLRCSKLAANYTGVLALGLSVPVAMTAPSGSVVLSLAVAFWALTTREVMGPRKYTVPLFEGAVIATFPVTAIVIILTTSYSDFSYVNLAVMAGMCAVFAVLLRMHQELRLEQAYLTLAN